MKKVFGNLADVLEKNGSISHEDREVYVFAMKTFLIQGSNIIISLLLGYWLQSFWYCALFLCVMIPLRSDAGGYHAPGPISCFLLSFSLLAGALLWIKGNIPHKLTITVCLAVFLFPFILKHAPLAAKTKPLDEQEKKIIGKRARIIVTVELLAGLFFVPVNARIACTVLCAIIWCGIGYIGWFLDKKWNRKIKN